MPINKVKVIMVKVLNFKVCLKLKGMLVGSTKYDLSASRLNWDLLKVN